MSDTTKTLQNIIASRQTKLQQLREKNAAYPNDFCPNQTIDGFIRCYEGASREDLDSLAPTIAPIKLAGRVMLHRPMGKSTFAHIGDENGRLQLYTNIDLLEDYKNFTSLDTGDIIGVTGKPYRTQKGELSLRVSEFKLLTKSLLPMPDKFHGLNDIEIRYRQRYLDLMVNSSVMQIFKHRSLMVQEIRTFMMSRDFLEVETPMLHPIPGGANARPFVTHHNALDTDLYLRIAPELYLKRLIVGGMLRIFEINRNFRNEGISPNHNPEFTMMEFYQAYATYEDLMDLLEAMIVAVTNKLSVRATQLDFPFKRISMLEAVNNAGFNTDNVQSLMQAATKLMPEKVKISSSRGEIIALLFEEVVQPTLIQPTFITDFPVEVSPLARRSDKNPSLTDRFELYIYGQEIANGFSELNDAEDQANRFKEQVKLRQASNDEEAMYYDEDYINALKYGMPPTAGAGIGIDRLAMVLLGQESIKDVILFPNLKPKKD